MNNENKQNHQTKAKPNVLKYFHDSLHHYNEDSILNGQYVVGARLSASSTGDIYAGWTKGTTKKVLLKQSTPPFYIKFLPQTFPRSQQAQQLFIEEAKRLQTCCQSVNLLAVDNDAEDAYVIFQLPVGHFFSHELIIDQPYADLSQSLVLIGKIHSALKKVQTHCDLSHGLVDIDSLFITEAGEVVLLDLIYTSTKQRQLKEDIDCSSTIPNREALYASPDACFGRKIGEGDDVFSLASILYRLLSGKHPYQGINSVSALLNKVSLEPIESLEPIQWQHLKQAMAFCKNSRLQSIDQFIEGFPATQRLSKASNTKEREEATQLAQQLITEQNKVKSVSKKCSRLKPSTQKTKKVSLHATPFELPEWGWIPLSLFIGILCGVLITMITIQWLNVDLFSIF